MDIAPVDQPMSRELMKAMLFDDHDSMGSDEDWGAFAEQEAAMRQAIAQAGGGEDRFAPSRGKKKKKKKGMPRDGGAGRSPYE